MQEIYNKQYPIEWLLFFFMLAHLVCWTAAPALIRYNLPMDAIEGATWGHELQLGYDKNPFLNGWLTAFAISLNGYQDWLIYLFSQLSVVTAFLAIWLLAKKIVSPILALLSVLMLEGVQYFNFHAIDFNDNTLELSLWALTIYFFYCAITPSGRHLTRDWLLTGLFSALGLMAKYYTLVLLLCMFFFLLSSKEGRKHFQSRSLYLGLQLFFILILPHCVWLFFHDFITITYVFDRADAPPSWINHFFYPAQFAWDQCLAFLPALLLLLFLYPYQRAKTIDSTNLFNRRFLWYMGVGPFLLTLFLSFLFGIHLRAGWGMPLLSLWGLLILFYLNPKITKAKLTRFTSAVFILLLMLVTGYALALLKPNTPSSANYPGLRIAQTVTAAWRMQYHVPLKYVAGLRWIAGNVSFYSPDHPIVFMEWDIKRSPWIHLDAMKKAGALFVWDKNKEESFPAAIKARFPTLIEVAPLQFTWRRDHHQMPPIQIGIAFLPPEAS